MKKVFVLTLILTMLFSSTAFAALREGKIGIDAFGQLIGNPTGNNTSISGGSLFYHFTEDLSASIGVTIVNDKNSAIFDAKDTWTGIALKGYWNLARGKMVPRLGLEAVYYSADLNSVDGNVNALAIHLLFGGEVMWLPNLSTYLDVVVLDYSTMTATSTVLPDAEDANLAILSGTTFGIRWYIN
jgi:hypothetical protein